MAKRYREKRDYNRKVISYYKRIEREFGLSDYASDFEEEGAVRTDDAGDADADADAGGGGGGDKAVNVGGEDGKEKSHKLSVSVQ